MSTKLTKEEYEYMLEGMTDEEELEFFSKWASDEGQPYKRRKCRYCRGEGLSPCTCRGSRCSECIDLKNRVCSHEDKS